jgi:hypothetical protein
MNTEEIPKPHNADADPVKLWGRLPLSGKRALSAPAGSAGVLVTACAPGKPDATRETQRRGEGRETDLQPVTREGRNGAQLGVGEAHSTEGNRVTPVEGRGLSLGTRQEEMTAGRLAKAYQLHLRSENLRQPCVPKRRERITLVGESMNHLSESRMREIRLSGLMRGGRRNGHWSWRPLNPSPPAHSTIGEPANRG